MYRDSYSGGGPPFEHPTLHTFELAKLAAVAVKEVAMYVQPFP